METSVLIHQSDRQAVIIANALKLPARWIHEHIEVYFKGEADKKAFLKLCAEADDALDGRSK